MRSLVKRHRLLRQHFFTSGEHFWEAEIVRCSSTSALIIGVAASEQFECETLLDARTPWAMSATLGYAATGAVLKNGREVARVTPFGAGDTVGVLLDMNERCVSFFLNDIPQCARSDRDGDAASGARVQDPDAEERKSDAAYRPTTPLRVRFEPHALFPAVTCGVDSDEVDVRMRLLLPAE